MTIKVSLKALLRDCDLEKPAYGSKVHFVLSLEAGIGGSVYTALSA